VSVLGSAILPPRGMAIVLLVAGVLLSAVLWRALVKMHARLQAALRDTLDRPSPHE
jgi:CPA2 family monovalent cation:H+ antiporter-2